MRVELEKDQLDLGVTPIENMFINTLMASANESQIKVYLYALSLAHRGIDNISNENIAKEMNLTEGQVMDAWSYWMNMGIISKNGDTYIFKSIRGQLFGAGYPTIQDDSSLNVSRPSNESYKLDDSQNQDEQTNEVREMFDSIESFISQGANLPIKLDPREMRKIKELMDEFKVSPEFISYAYMLASNERGKKAVDPIVATIRNWMIDGATDMEKLDAYMLAKQTKNTSNNNTSTISKKSKGKSLADNDDRMTKDERIAFVEEKMKKRIPIKKKNND